MNTRHLYHRAAVAAVVSLAAACGPLHREPTSDTESAVVYFTNESLDQADVYAISSGSRRTRIGTVMSGRTETLVIPTAVLGTGDINVVARLLARNDMPGTGPFYLHAGDEFSVRLPADARTLVLLPAGRQVGDVRSGAPVKR